MERMEGLLFEASLEGNLPVLLTLLQEDPLILDRVTVNCCDNMPLHVASMLGHTDFVKEIVNRKPQLATEPDSQRRLPLHLASAKGHVEIVKALVLAHPETCLVRDRDGRNPLHVAAIKGRYEVVKELLKAQPHAARVMVEQETILHLCVKHNQLEVLKLLVETMGDHEFVNSKDADGNTILHLAVIDKQLKTINFLLLDTTIEVDSSNTNGDTPMNILAQRPKDEKDQQIIQSLLRAGAVDQVKTEDIFGKVPQNGKSKMGLKHYKKLSSPSDALKRKKEKWFDNKRNFLIVVASLIATIAFQAGINPPGGVWQQDVSSNTTNPAGLVLTNINVTAGEAIMAYKYPVVYRIFIVSNSLGFGSTISIVVLLSSGLHFLKHPVFTWIMMFIMWIAVASMSVTYLVSLWFLTPNPEDNPFKWTVIGVVGVWMVLITLLFMGHIINGVVKVIKKLLKCAFPRIEGGP